MVIVFVVVAIVSWCCGVPVGFGCRCRLCRVRYRCRYFCVCRCFVGVVVDVVSLLSLLSSSSSP